MVDQPVTESSTGVDTDRLPTGVVTFLFSDIEGSTRKLEEHRAAAGTAFARHHDLVREAVESASGLVFETVGDAVYGAFARPADAVAAAVAAHRALEAEDWGEVGELQVRIAVHSGTVETRGAHYFGPALFECARLQSLAHGGQTLTSAAASALAGKDLADGVELRALGTHRLKDLDEPMEVFQVEAPGLRTRFPPLRASTEAQTNLPTETTAFVGREPDLESIGGLLSQSRLVSLVGAGGSGKTRLAAEAGARQLYAFPDGVWIAELAPVASPEFVVSAVADVWGLRAGEGSSLEEVVARFLSTRRLLLIVDNCEHLVDSVAGLLDRLLKAAPDVRLLATSRESLGVPGESVYRVPPLPLPEDREHAADSDSVRLFVDRARSIRHDFSPSPDELDAVVRVCRRLDGMPLGLELAASRLRTLSPGELADRLEDSFRILTGGARTTLPRQRTLQATIDWSHELLSDAERALFRRLAVFAGGFDLAAAEAVCTGDPVAEVDVLDLLDSLVDKSLVLAAHGASSRFRLLEPIRQYGEERLAGAGESDAVRQAHARHYAAFVAEAAPYTRGPEQMAWERRLDSDYDNVRVAFHTLLEAGDLDRYLSMGFDLFIYWMHLGMHVEGIATLLAGSERAPGTSDPARLVKAWFVVAALGAEITDPKSIGHARSGLALAQTLDDPNAVGRMELQLGAAIRHSTTDPAFLEHLEEGRRLLETNPEPYWWEPEWERGLLNLVYAAYFPPEDERMLEHVEAAIESFERAGDQALLAATLGDSIGLWGRADEQWLMGNVVRSVEILGSLQVPYWYGHALQTLGSILEQSGEHERAAGYLVEAAGHLEEMGDLNCWANSSRRLATAEAALGSHDSARARLAAVIEAMPILPMPEIHKPRVLDAAAEILLAAGLAEQAAFALGRAGATEFPVPTLFPREPRLEAARAEIEQRLGYEEATRLTGEGTAATVDAALGQIRDWLRGR
jgi:predicted ATPase/class 3 adenylate cyclase/tetratricopeptide (TPR) repeat protein